MGIGLLLASAASGCVSRTFVHPLDTIRSRLMVSTSHDATFRRTAGELLRHEGMRGLYRGFGISVTMQAPAIATFLTTYDMTKSQFPSSHASSPFVHLLSGLVAETISAVFWVPMEVIKQRAQVRSLLSNSNSVAIVKDLVRHEGPSALFKGYGLTIAVFGPYSMIYFMAYERFKIIAKNRNADGLKPHDLPQPSMLTIAPCAGLAGAIAAACTTPLDVVKTRIQTQDDLHHLQTATTNRTSNHQFNHRRTGHKSTWHVAKTIVQQDGFRGLFRGVSARVLWIVPSTAITMTTFESLKSYFKLSATSTSKPSR